jgi:hypothetical protein
MATPATAPVSRAQTNRANAKHSTGPRTEAGKQRASLNALRHGLTSQSPVLPSEDLAAFNRHVQQFLDEYRAATPTETQLVHELAHTAWRQNRIPLIEAGLFKADFTPQHLVQALSTLGMHGQRLSRQFQKTLDQLRTLQAERREREQKELKDAAVVLEFHKRKQIPWDPADSGFVFSKEEVERHAKRMAHVVQGRQLASTAAFPRVADHIAY